MGETDMLIAMAGLPGTGKSMLAQRLAQDLPAVVLDKDAIRAVLFAPDDIEYTARQDDFCQSLMLQVAAYLWQRDGHARSIIFDGRTFSHAYQRAHLVAFVRDQRVPLLFIECVCSDETARRRLAADAASGVHPARNRDDALYRRVKDLFEPITEPKIVVDTDRALEDYLPTCLAAVRAFMTA
jgi:predicted kinase